MTLRAIRLSVLFFLFLPLTALPLAAQIGQQVMAGEVPLLTAETATEAVFSLEPARIDAKPGAAFTVAVVVDPKQASVGGVALEVVFDPAVLRVESAEPGAFLGERVEVTEGFPEMDNETGRVRLEAAAGEPLATPVEPGVFYELGFVTTPRPLVEPPVLSIENAIVAAAGDDELVVGAAAPAAVEPRVFGRERVLLDAETSIPRAVTDIDVYPAQLEKGAVALTSANADAVFRSFLGEHQQLFQVRPEDLRFDSFKEVGEKRLVRYQQTYRGLPIHHATVGLVATSGGKVLSYDAEYHPKIDLPVEPKLQLQQAAAVARDAYESEQAAGLKTNDARLLVYPLEAEGKTEYHLAWKFMLAGERPNPRLDRYFFVDALDGTILHSYPRYGPDRVQGNVTGEVYPENPDNPPIAYEPLGHLESATSGRTANTNRLGDYSISPLASGSHRVTFTLEGPYAQVADVDGSEFERSRDCNTTSDCDLQWSAADEDGINVFYHMNLLRDWYRSRLGYSWVNPWTGTAQFTAEVNDDTYDNAHAGDPMLFGTDDYARSSDVVYHECTHNVLYHLYGDWIGFSVSTRGEGYAFDEGFSDYFAGSITEDPRHGEGYGGTRTLDNSDRYPGKAGYWIEGHTGGRIIGGAAWDLRQAFAEEEGQARGTRRADRLVFDAHQVMANQPRQYFFSDPRESNFLHSLYLADDDNGNLEDGVPHFVEIHRAFGNHGLLQAVLDYGNSFDVSANQLGLYGGGDFYLSSSGRFYANNLGQRGLLSVGDTGSLPLEDLDVPESRYTRFGVPIVAGDTYVSRAEQGEEDNYIAFRVIDHDAAGGEATIEYWYLSRMITLQDRDSYDFDTQLRREITGGDLYLLDRTFWANNRGQGGLVDLGNLGMIALERVAIPSTGYYRFGVPAVVGHTYVSRAGQGEDGYFIVFRVRGITGLAVELEALYKKGDRVVLYDSNSFDFSERVRGRYSGGDFYLTNRRFYANNWGQRGLVDLGYTGGADLEGITPPARGYTRFGVDAVSGHTYVARAQQGEEGNFVVFRVADSEGEAVVLDYHYRNETSVTLAPGQGYDFSERRLGGVADGDFYFVQSKFWANNWGQRGVQSLGDLGSVALDSVTIPGSGYTRFGVPVVSGHTYVALAEQGEEGSFIVFRVESLDAGAATLRYLLVTP